MTHYISHQDMPTALHGLPSLQMATVSGSGDWMIATSSSFHWVRQPMVAYEIKNNVHVMEDSATEKNIPQGLGMWAPPHKDWVLGPPSHKDRA